MTTEKRDDVADQNGLRVEQPQDKQSAMGWDAYSARLLTEWKALLNQDPEPDEKDVQKFLELHPSLLPGGFGDVGPSGHHGPWLGGVYREPPLKGLNRQRRPDFMWVTSGTDLVTPICIEIEKPNRPWFKKNGRPSRELTEALDQLADWKVWFSEPENQSIFRKTYVSQDFEHRVLKPQYVLIYGRAAEFMPAQSRHKNPNALRKKRGFMARQDEYFYTFDSLEPNPKAKHCTTLSMKEDGGPELFSFPATFETTADTMDDAVILRDPAPALVRSKWMDEGQKNHIREMWRYWQSQGDQSRTNQKTARR